MSNLCSPVGRAPSSYTAIAVSPKVEGGDAACALEVATVFAAALRERVSARVSAYEGFYFLSERDPARMLIDVVVGFNADVGAGAVVLDTEPPLAPPGRIAFSQAIFFAPTPCADGQPVAVLRDTLVQLAETFATQDLTIKPTQFSGGPLLLAGREWNIVVRHARDDTRITETVCAVAPDALARHPRLGDVRFQPGRGAEEARIHDFRRDRGHISALHVEAAIPAGAQRRPFREPSLVENLDTRLLTAVRRGA